MTEILEYRVRNNGLGIIVIELCVLLATKKHVHAFVNDKSHMLFELKKIFDIDDDQLEIFVEPNCINDAASDDLMKSFVPYFSKETVKLFGKEYQVGSRNKPCIGLAMHHGGGMDVSNPDPLGHNRACKDFPYNKFATHDIYSSIVRLATDAGYDIITFNNPKVSVEYKCFLLNNLCDCVIGYEGGLAQLAHMLKVPCIMLPWKCWIDGNTRWQDGSAWDPRNLEAHKYHIDHRTFFLTNQEQIVSWTRSRLKQVIDDLYNNNGNNFLFASNVKLDLDTLVLSMPGESDVLPSLPAQTKKFILQHISNPGIH